MKLQTIAVVSTLVLLPSLAAAQVSNEIGRDLEKHVRKAIDQAFKKFPLKERAN